MVNLIPAYFRDRLVGFSKTDKYRVFIFLLTFFVYTSYHLSRKPISVVKSVLHRNCTGHNETNSSCSSWAPFDGDNYADLLGSLDSAFLFAYAVGMFLSGHIAERMNLRIFLGVGMLGAGLFTAMFGVGRYLNMHTLAYYVCFQVVAGLFQATGWPSVVTCMGNWFGKGKRGLIMGIWNSHTSVGNILGSVIAAAFVEKNWGLSFIVPGAIIAFLGVVVLIFLKPHPRDAGCQLPDHIGEDERRRLAVEIDEVNDELHNAEVDKDIRQGVVNEYVGPEEEPLLADPVIVVPKEEEKAISTLAALKIPGVVEFSLCLFFAKLVSYTFLFWLPNYIHYTARYSASISADLSTVFDFGGIIGGVLAGLISDVTKGRATTCFVMLLLAAPALFVYEAIGAYDLATNVVGLLITGALVNGPYALITTAVSADLGTHHSLLGNSKALSTVTAIIDGTGSIGAAVGPLLTGLLSGPDHPDGWKHVFYMLIGANLIAMLLLFRLVTKEIRSCCQSRRTL